MCCFLFIYILFHHNLFIIICGVCCCFIYVCALRFYAIRFCVCVCVRFSACVFMCVYIYTSFQKVWFFVVVAFHLFKGKIALKQNKKKNFDCKWLDIHVARWFGGFCELFCTDFVSKCIVVVLCVCVCVYVWYS